MKCETDDLNQISSMWDAICIVDLVEPICDNQAREDYGPICEGI